MSASNRYSRPGHQRKRSSLTSLPIVASRGQRGELPGGAGQGSSGRGSKVTRIRMMRLSSTWLQLTMASGPAVAVRSSNQVKTSGHNGNQHEPIPLDTTYLRAKASDGRRHLGNFLYGNRPLTVSLLAPAGRCSSEAQQPTRPTTVLGRRPRSCQTERFDRAHGRAGSLHPEGRCSAG